MDLTLTLSGQRCDLSLHPVSPKTVERIHALGRKFYTKKYIHWWRNGNTSTCGMKYGDDCALTVTLDGAPIPFDASSVITESAVLLRRRHYLESKARYLALLGYDDEHCTMHWTWQGVTDFDPARFDFFVHRWDRVLGEEDYLIVDDVRYNGSFADEQDWGGSCGFSLVDPRIIDLDALRRDMGIETVAAQGAPAPSQPAPFLAGKGPYLSPVPGANAVGTRSCTVCKDSIRVELRIENDTVVAAGGMAEGCDYSKECLAALSRMVIGRSIYDCYPITNEDLHEHLTRVMPKLDCDYFTVGALKLALRNWEKAAA
jgi:NifU-like protein involved in Fe-S cluster formation